MDLKDYKKLSTEDMQINLTNMKQFSVDLPLMTVKWLQFLSSEKLILNGYDLQHKITWKRLYLYYSGLGETAYEYVLGKSEIKQFIDADDDMVDLLKGLYLQKEKVEFITKVCDTLNKTSFQIKNAVEMLKFENGG
jgi:hypothetical protein